MQDQCSTISVKYEAQRGLNLEITHVTNRNISTNLRIYRLQ